MSRMRALAVAAVTSLSSFACRSPVADAPPRADVVPNDNRVSATLLRGDTTVFTLDARVSAWRPDERVDTSMTVFAFASTDGVPRIPGPLLRVTQGGVVEIRIQNHLPDSTLVVHGLRPGSSGVDTVQVAAGATRIVHFTATSVGTFQYWSRAAGNRMERDDLRDGLLSGAIVVDAAGVARDTAERIMVINALDILPDSSKPIEHRDDLFVLTMNGLVWPYTEPLQYVVGDTVKWRVVNTSNIGHPMHLHGFHFLRTARGDGATDTLFEAGQRALGVTELMRPGSTFAIQWTPTRAGNWLFHCHFLAHIVPFPPRPDSVHFMHRPDVHDTSQVSDADAAAAHARDAMWGLVMAVKTVDRDASRPTNVANTAPATRTLRLLAQQTNQTWPGDSIRVRGYVLQQGSSAPRRDSVVVPGPMLLLTRGERTAINVINHLPQPTSVHWHGMELESYYDGVAGWSGADARRAPMVSPGDSFVAIMTPPRAGTFMYHPHMDEEDQLGAGLFGPLIVLEPGERFNPETDLVFMLGTNIVNGMREQTVNATLAPKPVSMRAGQSYRLRFLNIAKENTASIRLTVDTVTQAWTPYAKDGATLPLASQRQGPAWLRSIASGETYDFTYRPAARGDAMITVNVVDVPTPIRIPVQVH